ncbi:hypothetical protein F7201_03530 [Helicobacter pylori]|nr:hypothetical protein [Helicobacter pylori]
MLHDSLSSILNNKGAFAQVLFNFKRDYATIRDIMLSIKGVFDQKIHVLDGGYRGFNLRAFRGVYLLH